MVRIDAAAHSAKPAMGTITRPSVVRARENGAISWPRSSKQEVRAVVMPKNPAPSSRTGRENKSSKASRVVSQSPAERLDSNNASRATAVAVLAVRTNLIILKRAACWP